NYVKRCVGTPGDVIESKNGDLYVNGELFQLSDRAKPQYVTTVRTKEKLTQEFLTKYEIQPWAFTYVMKSNFWDDVAVRKYFNDPKNKVSLSEDSRDSLNVYAVGFVDNPGVMERLGIQIDGVRTNLTVQQAEQLKNNPDVKSVARFASASTKAIFPHTKDWSQDNFGPIYIPKKGETVELNAETLPFYKEIIREYEKNDLKVIGNEILINNQPATTYTFKQDYYWMMGDNRHSSEDSR